MKEIKITIGHLVFALIISFFVLSFFITRAKALEVYSTNGVDIGSSNDTVIYSIESTSNKKALAQNIDFPESTTFDSICFNLHHSIGNEFTGTAQIKLYYQQPPPFDEDNLVWTSDIATIENLEEHPTWDYKCVHGDIITLGATRYYAYLVFNSTPANSLHMPLYNFPNDVESSLSYCYLASNGTTWYCPPQYGLLQQVVDLDLFLNNVHVDNLFDGNYFVNGDTITFSGSCPTNGTDQIEVSFRQDSANGYYTIDCIDNTWTYETTAECSGSEQLPYYFFDKAYPVGVPYRESNYATFIQFNCVPTSYEWNLNLLYPLDDGSHILYLKENPNFPIKISYRVPFNIPRDEITLSFHSLDSCGGNLDYSYINNTLNIVDDADLGYVIDEFDVVASQDICYTIGLTYNSVVYFQYNFEVKESTTGQDGTLPSTEDLGFWGNLFRTMFVPREGFINSKINNIKDLISSKAPFSYFYEYKTQFENVNVNTSRVLINPTFTIDNKNFSLTFLDTNDEDQSNALSIFRVWSVRFLYFMFVSYLIFRALHFFDNKNDS